MQSWGMNPGSQTEAPTYRAYASVHWATSPTAQVPNSLLRDFYTTLKPSSVVTSFVGPSFVQASGAQTLTPTQINQAGLSTAVPLQGVVQHIPPNHLLNRDPSSTCIKFLDTLSQLRKLINPWNLLTLFSSKRNQLLCNSTEEPKIQQSFLQAAEFSF